MGFSAISLLLRPWIRLQKLFLPRCSTQVILIRANFAKVKKFPRLQDHVIIKLEVNVGKTKENKKKTKKTRWWCYKLLKMPSKKYSSLKRESRCDPTIAIHLPAIITPEILITERRKNPFQKNRKIKKKKKKLTLITVCASAEKTKFFSLSFFFYFSSRIRPLNIITLTWWMSNFVSLSRRKMKTRIRLRGNERLVPR